MTSGEATPSRAGRKAAALGLGILAALGLWAISVGAETPDAAAGAAEGADVTPSAADAAPARPAVSVGTQFSEAVDFRAELVLRGVTEPARIVELRAQTDGLVVSAPRRKGDRVARGDTLCQIEPGVRQARVDEATALVAQARIDAEASQSLSQRGFSSAAKAAADAAALAAAQANLSHAELDLARTTIRAPFSGLLETDAAETGALLEVGAVCAALVALNPIRIVGFASEGDLGALVAGAPARARLIDGRVIEGEITFVSRVADPGTRTYRVEATAANAEETIPAGMTAELRVEQPPLSAHLAPQSALTLDAAGRLGVRVADGEVARFHPVKMLSDTAEGVWLGGLPDQIELIVRGQDYVTDGAAIRPTRLSERTE